MKTMHRIIYALIALNVIGAAVFILLAPDQVPVHFGMNGEANRMGSKYEALFLPALAVAFGLGLVFTANRSDSHDTSMLLKADIVLQVLMAAFMVFTFAKAFPLDSTPLAAIDFNMNRGGALVTGIALIAYGNIMPKSDRNETFGLRTPWSLSNDEVWRKSQRFCGRASIAAGATMLVGDFVLPSNLVLPALFALALASAGASIVASYCFYRSHYAHPE